MSQPHGINAVFNALPVHSKTTDWSQTPFGTMLNFAGIERWGAATSTRSHSGGPVGGGRSEELQTNTH